MVTVSKLFFQKAPISKNFTTTKITTGRESIDYTLLFNDWIRIRPLCILYINILKLLRKLKFGSNKTNKKIFSSIAFGMLNTRLVLEKADFFII